jgi:hypothetical protein
MRISAAVLPARLHWKTAGFFALLSSLYFADTLLRASAKTFWCDELYTVYLCRLPSFSATWAAVLHGCDFNPPLLYLLTRTSEHFLGEGPIATRLPALLGFWIFALGLYVFSSRRLGRLCGLIAALLPSFTLAYFYASEARASGIVLGWAGLMLVCWQRSRESQGPARRLAPWLLGLFVCFLAALLTHVYAAYIAVPLLLIEASSFSAKRRVHLGICAALLLPLAAVAPLYRRMVNAYGVFSGGRGWQIHPIDTLGSHLYAVYGPAIALLLIGMVLLATTKPRAGSQHSAGGSPSFTREELALAIGLAALPAMGVLGVLLNHGPFFDRYFLAETAGCALLLAQLFAQFGTPRSARAMVTALLLLLSWRFALDGFLSWRHLDLRQVEPVSHFAFADPHQPLQNYTHLLEGHDRPILVTEVHQYLYLYYYAPPMLRSRLVFGAPHADDPFLFSYRSLARWGNVDLHTTTYDSFFSSHNDFFVYRSKDGNFNGDCGDCTQSFLAAGYALLSVEQDADNLLEHYSR